MKEGALVLDPKMGYATQLLFPPNSLQYKLMHPVLHFIVPFLSIFPLVLTEKNGGACKETVIVSI